MLAVGFLAIAVGSALLYAAIQNQSVADEFRAAFGLATDDAGPVTPAFFGVESRPADLPAPATGGAV